MGLDKPGKVGTFYLEKNCPFCTKKIEQLSTAQQVADWQIQFLPKHWRRNGTTAVFFKRLVILVSDEIDLVRIHQAYYMQKLFFTVIQGRLKALNEIM